jgi:hypothetical protein
MRADQKTATAGQTKAVVEQLSNGDLEKVCGGTKTIDKSSPNLFALLATGKHFT